MRLFLRFNPGALVFALGALIGIMPGQSFAGPSSFNPNHLFLELNQSLAKLDGAKSTCRSQSAAGPSPCESRYQRLFAKPVVKIAVAFSYFDVRPDWHVGVRDQVLDFMRELGSSCSDPHPQILCGFKQDAADADVFSKQVPGPDGKSHEVRIRIITPIPYNRTDSDNDNILRKDPEQRRDSESARESYMRALRRDDVVIYQGHSRNGGGPDFFPPRLKPNLHVDYPWYEKHHPGLNDLLGTLRASKHRPEALAILSCDSRMHFKRLLHPAAPKAALLLTNIFVDAGDMDLGRDHLIAGLVSQSCDPGFLRGAQSKWANYPRYVHKNGKVDPPTFSFEGWASPVR